MAVTLSREERKARRELRREKQRQDNVSRAKKMHILRKQMYKENPHLPAYNLESSAYVGCSGWFYWKWRGLFYPKELPTGEWFKHYANRFDTVEINASFYSWPTAANVKAWKRQAERQNFVYTVKVCELITHIKKFKNTKTLVKDFGTIADLLGDRMGCFLFQLPPSLVLGVIPSALPMVSMLTKAMESDHPKVEFTVLSQSSEEIIRALHDFSIEAGITYLDNEPVKGLKQAPLYVEHYCLFVADDHPYADKLSVTWLEAAQEPLCLLTPNMQNRRIIDRAFTAAKAHPSPKLETNSIMNLLASVRSMGLASIMPEYFINVLGRLEGVRAIPLIEPKVEHAVGLVGVPREPLSPLVSALFVAANKIRT